MEPDHPPRPAEIHIDVTVTPNRRLGRLIGTIAIGVLQLAGVALHVTHLILHAAGHPW